MKDGEGGPEHCLKSFKGNKVRERDQGQTTSSATDDSGTGPEYCCFLGGWVGADTQE